MNEDRAGAYVYFMGSHMSISKGLQCYLSLQIQVSISVIRHQLLTVLGMGNVLLGRLTSGVL